jgi:hypothetical protein
VNEADFKVFLDWTTGLCIVLVIVNGVRAKLGRASYAMAGACGALGLALQFWRRDLVVPWAIVAAVVLVGLLILDALLRKPSALKP